MIEVCSDVVLVVAKANYWRVLFRWFLSTPYVLAVSTRPSGVNLVDGSPPAASWKNTPGENELVLS